MPVYSETAISEWEHIVWSCTEYHDDPKTSENMFCKVILDLPTAEILFLFYTLRWSSSFHCRTTGEQSAPVRLIQYKERLR